MSESNRFANIDALNDAFVSGQLKTPPQQIFIHDIKFVLSSGSKYDLSTMLFDGKKGYLIYSLDTSKDNVDLYNTIHTTADNDDPSNIQDRIALLWGVLLLRLVPAKALTISQHRLTNLVREAYDIEGNNVSIGDKLVLKSEVDIQLVGFNKNEAIKARIDTGAGQCSLHGEQVKFSDELVQFTFNGVRYKMELADTQDIRSSDGGDEKRPCVSFNIKIGDQLLNNIIFNINDRSNMPHEILLGQNALTQGRFIIDPTLEESAQLEALETFIDNIEIELVEDHVPSTEDKTDELLNELQQLINRNLRVEPIDHD